MQSRKAVRREGVALGTVTVRPAAIRDAEALARLSVQLGYPSSRERVERRLASLLGQPGHVVLVAEAESEGGGMPQTSQQVVAWIHGFVQPLVESDPTAQIGGLVVDEEWRGRGAGRLLVEHLERWARSASCATVTVRSNVVREEAHQFYQKMGYRVVKTQRVFSKKVAH
ncbi:MAG TPA: GNAT family N-acetyltransferase [Terriglobia bacterium]|nr:GNAT family N-acetyltransferase [Terriglobia bacterium]